MAACDLEGKPVFWLPLSPSSSPSCTDESLVFFNLDLEALNGRVGGLTAMIVGMQSYFCVHVFDKGFR